MRFSSLLGLALAGRSSALIGYGISMYKPNCAFACRDQFAGAHLECTSMDHAGGGHHGSSATSPACYAQDTSWLTTLAYCINQTCTDIPRYKLEAYWAERVTKNTRGNKLEPKWTYQETLMYMADRDPPSRELEEDEVLEFTALFNPEALESIRGALQHFELAETTHSKFAIILLVTSFAIPVCITAVSYLPFMSSLSDKVKPWLVWPSVLGAYHVRPFLFGNVPTLGQAWYIIMFILLNVIATAAGYHSFQSPSNSWFPDRWQEIMAYVSARTGVLAFALAPFTILLAGRNNILLWMTNWSHSTYLLLHRWVARMFTLQVILHSILEFMLYKRQGEVEAEQKEPYWIWGIVATVACVIMVVISTLFFRRKSYEIFLILHIVLAVLVLAGSWYHVELLFARKWGYEFWLYAACGVWFFDRLIRVGRILKNGRHRAEVTQISEDIVRVDVKDVRWQALPGRHTYAYFPMLKPLRPWENHPFSIIPTTLLRPRTGCITTPGTSIKSKQSSQDIEKSGAIIRGEMSTDASLSSSRSKSTAGISLYVRKSAGLTRALERHASLLTLLDGPYPNNSTAEVLKTDRLVLIAGGIGITAVLPFLAHHSNVKLYWSLKSNCRGLVDDLSGLLESLPEKKILVDQRIDFTATLDKEEAEGWGSIGIVACGPGGFCDEVRSSVARRGRAGVTKWELNIEAFSW